VIDLWRSAGESGVYPSEADLRGARAFCGWDHIELTESGAVKRTVEARVDLGGVAKGFGIDAAVEVLAEAGMLGGLVDVGGDLRCFGTDPDGGRWRVEIKNPFGEGPLAHLRVGDSAVCTSGNYARFVEIEGRRYSHIIDPRSGRPADAVPSVTVISRSAMTADMWATALSVLGEEGLDLLPTGLEALLVLGSADDFRILCTQGAQSLIEAPHPVRLVIAERGLPQTQGSMPERGE
jgi:thiamine biosynthesis lipoprotein